MSYRTECKSCSDVKEKIDEEKGKFICLILAVLSFSILTGTLINLALIMLDEGENIFGMVFSVVVLLVFLVIWIRFLHLLISTYFLRKNYDIK